jgi:hypothetical protein
MRSVSPYSVVFLCLASTAWAQGTNVNATRARISERAVIGSTTLGDVLRIVGAGSVSGGAATMRPVVIDNNGDVRRDTNASVGTGGAWQLGSTLGVTGATTLSSTLGVTGATTLSSTLGVTGATTLSSTLSVASDISAPGGTLLATSSLQITTAAPFLRLIESGAGSDETVTELLADADTISLDLVADALGTRNSLFKSTRTGLVPGDWRWGALLNTIRPESNGGSSLGSLAKKYLTIHAWELWVQTLVAKEVISTVGGEVYVIPTTELTRDVASGDTVIYLKHNQPRTNDTLMLQAGLNGFEKMLVTSSYTDCSVSGNCAVTGSDYKYSVTRNRDGTGANDWAGGTAVINQGNVGDGYISLYADRAASTCGYPCQVIGDGPVAYWRMNETTTTTTADVMGNVGVATETGTQSNGLGVGPGPIGTSNSDPVWQNTNAGGYLLVADDTDLRITGDLTIEMIVYFENGGGTDNLFSRGGNGEYHLQVSNAGVLTFCQGNGSGNECESTASGFIPNNTYTHIAIVRDATSSPKRVLFYKNGAFVSSSTYTQAVTAQALSTGIGENPASTGAPWDGNIDEVAVYNYQVPADKILLHYQSIDNDSISKFTVGPTACGKVRTGTGAFDEAERWCIGNLRGLYDYSGSIDVYGAVFGNPSTTFLSMDEFNGIRGMFGSTKKFGITPAGVANFQEGAITIDDLGIRITNTTSTQSSAKAYRFAGNVSCTDQPAGLYYSENSGVAEIALTACARTGGNDILTLQGDRVIIAANEGTANIELTATSNLSINGSNGFSGTKTAGSCTFTLTKGIVTNVTGC